jgi:hypothetical protein
VRPQVSHLTKQVRVIHERGNLLRPIVTVCPDFRALRCFADHDRDDRIIVFQFAQSGIDAARLDHFEPRPAHEAAALQRIPKQKRVPANEQDPPSHWNFLQLLRSLN